MTAIRLDDEDLVLMSRRHLKSRNRMLEFAAQLIGAAVDDHSPLADRMANVFPWLLALSVKDRETCAQDLVDAARASFSTDQPHRVLAELTSWRETATALAAGLGQADVSERASS
nr:prevent-host-death protein [Gordonia sp. (in: high G+C Gram-positive bacteria)]